MGLADPLVRPATVHTRQRPSHQRRDGQRPGRPRRSDRDFRLAVPAAARAMAVVDVIVVCWNDKEKIATALDSVFALSEVRNDLSFARVVVSDNGSIDGSREFIRERYGDRVTIVENGANLGFAAGCNRAVAATQFGYIYLLNPDAELRDGALSAIVAFLDRSPRCGIAGSRIYNLDGTLQESCGEFDTWTGAFLRSSAWGELPLLRHFATGSILRGWDYRDERRV